MVTACPYLRGIPDGSAGAMATVNAARMLADLQPCAGVTVDRANLGVAGYSLGAGRAAPPRGATHTHLVTWAAPLAALRESYVRAVPLALHGQTQFNTYVKHPTHHGIRL